MNHTLNTAAARIAAFVFLAAAAASGVAAEPRALTRSESLLRASCAKFANTDIRNGKVTTAEFVPATLGRVNASSFPNHCLMRGAMNSRIGVDGQPYSLQFELRLPLAWNKRFFYQGGFYLDGTLFTATGQYTGGGNTRNALLDGYAVVTTDSGHSINPYMPNGLYAFGLDPQARLEYGFAQIPAVTDVAKRLLTRFYGAAADKSYFVGCSNGGRQAMVAAQKFPELFDGVIAAAPGFRLAQAAVNGLAQAQLTATVAPLGRDGRPDISKGLTEAEQAIVSHRILESCDAQDGARDGMVSKMSACNPDPRQWACGHGKSGNCLAPAKADFVKKLFDGGKLSDGRPIYAPWPYDPGMVAEFSNPFVWVFAGEASHIYGSPPTYTTDLLGYMLGANIDAEYARLFATSGIYTTAGVDFVNAESPDLDAFRKRNGKLMIYQGSADPGFSIKDVESYMKAVHNRYGAAQADGFARAYFIPGMDHCEGGKYGTDQFDALRAMVKWVEKGVAPDAFISRARAEAGVAWPGRTRPICTYPKEAIYMGSGSIEDARNFRCQ